MSTATTARNRTTGTTGTAAGHGEATPAAVRLSLTGLFLGAFAVGTDGFMISGLLPRISADLHSSISAAAQLVTVFAVGYAVGAPVLASLSGRMDRRVLLVAALAGLGVANAAAALAPSLIALFLARAAAALAAGAYSPAAAVVATGLVSRQRRGRALTVITAGLTVAIVAGVPLGNLAGGRFGWRATFTGVAVLSVLVAAGLRLLLPRIPAGPAISLRRRLTALTRPGIPIVLASTVLGILAGYLGYTYVAPISQAMGASGSALPIVLTGFGAGAALGSALSGAAVDRHGQGPTVRAGALIQVIALVWLSAGSLVQPRLGVAPAAVGFTLLGVGSWNYNAPQQHRLVELVPQDATTVVALNSSAIYTGIGLSAALGALTIGTGKALDGTVGGAALTATTGVVLALTTATVVTYHRRTTGRRS